MAKLERVLTGDFDQLLSKIEASVLDASVSASLEEQSDFRCGDSRCSVRVFERYSWTGGNRVSLSVTLYQAGAQIWLCAAATGGSQAAFCKFNTLGEEAFLKTLEKALE